MGDTGSVQGGSGAPLTRSCYCSGTPHTARCRVLRYADRQREGNVRAFDVMEPRARSGDPETSHAAARTVKNITELHKIIIDCLEYPSTDEYLFKCVSELDDLIVSPSGLRTRRAELVKLGKVVDSGERRTLQSGRLGIVWALVKEGV